MVSTQRVRRSEVWLAEKEDSFCEQLKARVRKKVPMNSKTSFKDELRIRSAPLS